MRHQYAAPFFVSVVSSFCAVTSLRGRCFISRLQRNQSRAFTASRLRYAHKLHAVPSLDLDSRALACWSPRGERGAPARTMPGSAIDPDEHLAGEVSNIGGNSFKDLERWLDHLAPIASATALEPLPSPVSVALCASGPVRFAVVAAMSELHNMCILLSTHFVYFFCVVEK